MRVYGYLRASTDEQDAKRAKNALVDFAESLGVRVSAWFVENESGVKLTCHELFWLLELRMNTWIKWAIKIPNTSW